MYKGFRGMEYKSFTKAYGSYVGADNILPVYTIGT